MKPTFKIVTNNPLVVRELTGQYTDVYKRQGGISQAGALHKQVIKVLLGHLRQSLHKRQFQAGAEDGAAVDLHHLDIIVAQDGAVDPQFSKFILNDADPFPLQRFQQPEQNSRLARP